MAPPGARTRVTSLVVRSLDEALARRAGEATLLRSTLARAPTRLAANTTSSDLRRARDAALRRAESGNRSSRCFDPSGHFLSKCRVSKPTIGRLRVEAHSPDERAAPVPERWLHVFNHPPRNLHDQRNPPDQRRHRMYFRAAAPPKYYDPAATLSDEQIRELVRIGTSAPTSFHSAELALHCPCARLRPRPGCSRSPGISRRSPTPP